MNQFNIKLDWSQGTVSIDVAALSATESAVVTETLKTALSW